VESYDFSSFMLFGLFLQFPGDYMIGTDGIIQAKFFLPEYQTRVASSEILMQRFGEKANGSSLLVKSEDLQTRITLSAESRGARATNRSGR
jgi:hypothetical protein